MPAPRFRVSGVPPEAPPGATAYLPAFVRLAGSGAQHYKSLTGGPARQIHVPGQQELANEQAGFTMALMGTARSSDAPDLIAPDQYIPHPEPAFWPGAGMPVQMYDPTAPWLTTMVPVPAVNPAIGLRENSAVLSAGVSSVQSARIRAMWDRPRSPSWMPRRRKGHGLANPSGRTNGSV
jgi:hypothetical protein